MANKNLKVEGLAPPFSPYTAGGDNYARASSNPPSLETKALRAGFSNIARVELALVELFSWCSHADHQFFLTTIAFD